MSQRGRPKLDFIITKLGGKRGDWFVSYRRGAIRGRATVEEVKLWRALQWERGFPVLED